ncbi:polysaccharide pyruvyl transferase family protein [Pontibacterium granulatum]|uniref:polysaccharide pyruvyl transferase family protein n=1 Tax=Pontibacterium granulatum TaxID=2036029 RepID=UPI00249C3405|nr:polysaccharide pyruvyl transferase family protein [Pontibacterium granulatum]MDI3322905.1 polysaccharide pyruvyl transferase family protein [Pontibacterium granulatum]
MKILHVASFVGNVGDNANHQGLRACLAQAFPLPHEITELEIRKCYRIYTGHDRWRFDDDFASLANEHDLVVIGGGNFFEPWLTESSTGTTIDLADAVLEKIQSPVVFFGVGFDTYKPCPDICLERFLRFSERLQKRPGTLMTFRNDGSFQNYLACYGNQSADRILVVPDGAFFYRPQSSLNLLEAKHDVTYWGINVASDMKDVRFPEDSDNSLSWSGFLQRYAAFLSLELERSAHLQLVLFPHIYKDLSAIGELLEYMDDRLCRDRITVAPYLHGWQGADQLFSLYQKCSLVMGMRFHTNVCAMAMGVPTIGLSSSPKIADLYKELGLCRRSVDVKRPDFVQHIESLVESFKSDSNRVIQENIELRELLDRQMAQFITVLKGML